jgi:dephospho-CoA kinase
LDPGGAFAIQAAEPAQALAAIVFAGPAARRDLEAIIHPPVRDATDRWFARLDRTQHPFAIADILCCTKRGGTKALRSLSQLVGQVA